MIKEEIKRSKDGGKTIIEIELQCTRKSSGYIIKQAA